MIEHEELQQQIGYFFRDVRLLRLALTHPSIAHEQGSPVQTNQRLEFLGDAVLQLLLTRELYDRYPDLGEGSLTKARARLVNRRSLAEHGRELGLGQYLLLSRGEDMHGGRDRPSALADTFEAVLGSIFLDGGLDAATQFVSRQFSSSLAGIVSEGTVDNPKGELQELLQSSSQHSPDYRIVSISGPDHDRLFECTVEHGGCELARGQGKSKKAAESAAALAALLKIRQSADSGQSRPALPESVS